MGWVGSAGAAGGEVPRYGDGGGAGVAVPERVASVGEGDGEVGALEAGVCGVDAGAGEPVQGGAGGAVGG